MVGNSSFLFEKVFDRWDALTMVMLGFALGLAFAAIFILKPYTPTKK